MTIFSASSASGRRYAFTSSHGALLQTSRSCSGVRITSIAPGWIVSGDTSDNDEALRNPGGRAEGRDGMILEAAEAMRPTAHATG